MTQNQLTRAKLESYSYTNIFDEMNKRSNIKDPRDPANTKSRMFIYDFDPFHKQINFGDFPYIILELPTIEYLKRSVDGKKKGILFKHRITVRTAREGASQVGSIDQGRTDMFNITDDMQEMFNAMTVRQTLINLGMSNMNLTKISTDTLTIDQKYVYESVFELSYDSFFFRVSA